MSVGLNILGPGRVSNTTLRHQNRGTMQELAAAPEKIAKVNWTSS